MTPSAQAPNFGPYNILQCRSGQIASFSLNASIFKDGLVVAMDFYPYSGESAIQTIFSIRNTATGFISLRVDYHRTLGTLNILVTSIGTASYLLDETTTPLIPIISGKIIKSFGAFSVTKHNR